MTGKRQAERLRLFYQGIPGSLPDAVLLDGMEKALSNLPSPVKDSLSRFLETREGGVSGQRKTLSRLKAAIRSGRSGRAEDMPEYARKAMLEFLAFLIKYGHF